MVYPKPGLLQGLDQLGLAEIRNLGCLAQGLCDRNGGTFVALTDQNR